MYMYLFKTETNHLRTVLASLRLNIFFAFLIRKQVTAKIILASDLTAKPVRLDKFLFMNNIKFSYPLYYCLIHSFLSPPSPQGQNVSLNCLFKYHGEVLRRVFGSVIFGLPGVVQCPYLVRSSLKNFHNKPTFTIL